jgi:hypothetical protein
LNHGAFDRVTEGWPRIVQLYRLTAREQARAAAIFPLSLKNLTVTGVSLDPMCCR